jgi:hypothetical protein
VAGLNTAGIVVMPGKCVGPETSRHDAQRLPGAPIRSSLATPGVTKEPGPLRLTESESPSVTV